MKNSIPLLDRNTRFTLWQVKMREVLGQMDLEEALLGFDRMPIAWTQDEKRSRDQKAQSQIHLHLLNQVLQDVLKENSAAALWLKLEQLCMTKSLTSKLHLKQRLYSHRMSEGMSLDDHLTMFKGIVADLEILEVKYDEEDLALILLCSLPPSYMTSRDTILYSRDTLTVEEVYDVLLSKEKIRHLSGRFGNHAKGLVVRRRNQDRNLGRNIRGRSKSRHAEKTCYYYKKKMHIS